jgi:DNA protecting protein DprA
MDDHELTALLALCHTFPSHRPKLAEHLLAARSARALLSEQPWASRPPDGAIVARVRFVMRASGLRAVPVWQWPGPLLRTRPLAPALFVRGNVDLLGADAIAVVGARDAHATAEAWAASIAAAHARQGLLIVSGGARGIDAAAHRGALDAGGRTLAYLGVSADRVYPSHNRRLFLRVLQSGGALVSEYLPLEATFSSGHAMRNRFIAAHASCVFIAEADTESGSLGTADAARRFGVPVVVSPPHIGVRRSGLESLIDGRAARYWATADGGSAGPVTSAAVTT